MFGRARSYFKWFDVYAKQRYNENDVHLIWWWWMMIMLIDVDTYDTLICAAHFINTIPPATWDTVMRVLGACYINRYILPSVITKSQRPMLIYSQYSESCDLQDIIVRCYIGLKRPRTSGINRRAMFFISFREAPWLVVQLFTWISLWWNIYLAVFLLCDLPYRSDWGHVRCVLSGIRLTISMAKCKPAVSPLLTHWRYCNLTLNHQLYVCHRPRGAMIRQGSRSLSRNLVRPYNLYQLTIVSKLCTAR